MSWWKRFQTKGKKEEEEEKGKQSQQDLLMSHESLHAPRLSSLFHEQSSSTSTLHSRTGGGRRTEEEPLLAPPSLASPPLHRGQSPTVLARNFRASEDLASGRCSLFNKTKRRSSAAEGQGSSGLRSSSSSNINPWSADAPRPSPATSPTRKHIPAPFKTRTLLRTKVKAISNARWFTHTFGPAVQAPTGIFAVPLSESIKYANVAISLTDADGKSFIYGYVPIVVAKCGVFLKEKGSSSKVTIMFRPCYHSVIERAVADQSLLSF